jgi:cytochrome c biogenesis protein CcmG/thiol:disulfide interchange protein DsbE
MWSLAVRTWAAALAAAITLGIARAEGSPRAGDPAPGLMGQTLDGQSFDLAALRGHVVVVNVWATWCPPCRAEMPMLNAFYVRHRAEGVVVIGLSADRPRDEADVRRAMQGLAYPAMIARRAAVNGLGPPTALPETIVVGADGVVRAVLAPREGAPLTADQLEAVVAPLLTAP